MKPKKKLSAAERLEKKRRKELYEWIFIRGKQVRVRRRPTIEGISVEDFIRQNADPIWLHQNEMWEYMETETDDPCVEGTDAGQDTDECESNGDREIPF